MTSGGGHYGGRAPRLKPSLDRSIPHPGRVWYSGVWRTPEYCERKRARQRVYDAKRRATLERRMKMYIWRNDHLIERDKEELDACTEAQARLRAGRG